MSDNDDDFDPELLIQEITQSVDCEQDNDPLNRIVTVEIDMFAQRLEDGFITRYNTKCPTAQIKFRDV